MSGNRVVIFDSMGEELGPADGLDTVPEWENALQRTARDIATANDGWIEDLDGTIIFDSQEEDGE